MMSVMANVDSKFNKDRSDNSEFEMRKTQKNKQLGW
jgi:hypothetical protein